jgi:peptidyl-dipeptidase A
MCKKILSILVLTGVIIMFSSCGDKKVTNEKDFDSFVAELNKKIIPLYKEMNLAYWDASISGKKEDFDKTALLQNQWTSIFADKKSFEFLKRIKAEGGLKDEVKNRELEVLYNQFAQNQADTAKLNTINFLQNEIEQKYGNFRAEVDGKKLTDNDVEDALVNSTDSKYLEKVWTAQKKIGRVVSDDIIKLVKMRNDVARDMGFKNYHEMKLKLSEQDPEEIAKLFDELDALTKDSFIGEKEIIDNYFEKRYKIKKEDLRPWHYQNRFFQEAPKIYKVDFDEFYKGKNLAELTEKYYKGIGIDISDILQHSDLYEKPGKNQHAYCIDIDNEGDIRVLCNIKPNEKWMNTMLHEFGHAAYDKYISKSLPFIMRDPAHTFTTEAIAMLFGRNSTNAQWLKANLGLNDNEVNEVASDGFKSLRLQQLVFSRWSQVMYRFEKSMYENPDQDLNKLWWELVEKYQLIKKPEGRNEPDWASKIHIATSPCYYHNYLLGELLASQLYHYIVVNIVKSGDLKNQSLSNNPEIGKYLIEKVFSPGMLYKWNDMIKRATGEFLTPKYYAEQFVK